MVVPGRIERRQLEKLVSWTSRERLRYLWYEFRLTVREVNFASYLMLDSGSRYPGPMSRGPAESKDPSAKALDMLFSTIGLPRHKLEAHT